MFAFSRISLAALCLGTAVCSSASADVTLKVGDPAPALAVAKFVKGEPVKQFEKGKIYVVEFWATWCPPCRESIPHLTQMQKDYPDVVFTGVDAGEAEETVTPFVIKMGDKMNYRVAVDDLTKPGGATDAAYMEAAGQQGIPTAFVIDKDSNIAWIGHPMAMAPVLKQVVAGKWDAKKAAKESDATAKVIALLEKNDLDGGMKLSRELVKADPSLTEALGMLQFQVLMGPKADPVAAAKKAGEIADACHDPENLNTMAWALATADKTTPDTLATAQKLSESAVKAQPDDWEFIDTLARVYAMKNDFAKASELESRAAAKCSDEKGKALAEKTLEAYKAGKLPSAE